jgi:hypothetical protein|tara:strand:+ start:66 stop:563 length:498 start_codon:yes stop_codon:yes gene_type:complete
MKRLNPETGTHFKQGDIREDGYIFWSYGKKIIKKTSCFIEFWRTLEGYQKSLNDNKVRVKKFAINNPNKMTEKAMRYHSEKLNRTPPWLTKEHFKQMHEIYALAKIKEEFTGEKHHVDHIEPLRGKDRCGLHVPWNLQVLTAEENIKKGNRVKEIKPTSVPNQHN